MAGWVLVCAVARTHALIAASCSAGLASAAPIVAVRPRFITG
jgi:hypothetical protein